MDAGVELGIERKQSSRISDTGESAELATFKHRLYYLRFASSIAALLHVVVSVITLVMGFTPGYGTEWLSQTIIVCAFGCLNTCVFAFVEMWRTITGTMGSLPSWTWHNNAFLSSVGNVFFLCLFALPSLVVYVLHSLGYEFFGVLTSQQNNNTTRFGVIMFHLIAGVGVFIMDGITIFSTTAKLRTFQSNRADETQGQDDEKSEKKEKSKEAEKDDDDGGEDYDEHRPVEPLDRVLALFSLFWHGVFTINLIVISATNPTNSGTVLSCVVMGGLFLGWFIYTIKCWSLKEVSESWLLNLRLLTILHLFALLLFFWIALCIVLLIAIDDSSGFFSTLQTINATNSDRGTLASVLIILIFFSVAVYGVILYVHSRSMWSLDEIASLYLAAKLQARLKEDISD